MKKQLFIKNVIILSLSSLIIRAIGMAFGVRAASVMGAEMLGRYRLTVSLYTFFFLLVTSGLSVTATRLAGDFLAAGECRKASYIRDKTILFGFLSGTILCGGMILLSFFLPTGFLGQGSVGAVRILALSLPFAAFSAALRGYFTAKRCILRTAAEQLLEQLSEITVFFAAFDYLEPAGISPLLCAALATTCAEVISFIYCIILWIADRRTTEPPEKVTQLFRLASPIAVPCTASAGLRSALSAVENSLIPAGLMLCGADQENALAEYGIISGMALPCVLFPSVLIIPFSQLIVTELSRENALGHHKSIMRISKKMLKVTIAYSLITTLPFLFFPEIIASALGFPSKAAFFIRVLAPLIPLSYLDSAVDGMLKGLDCQKSYFHINMIESVLRVIMALTLIPLYGAAGVIVIILFGELINVTLSLWKLLSVVNKCDLNYLTPESC